MKRQIPFPTRPKMTSTCSNPAHPSQSTQTHHTLKEILRLFIFGGGMGFPIASFAYEAKTDTKFSFTQF